MTSDWYGKKRLAGIGLSTLRHPITHDVSMGQEYLPSHFPLFMWPFFISCTRWQSIHGASALSKYRFHLWKSLPSWFFKQKTNTASILLKKIFGLISTSHLSITNLNLCSEILPIYVHPNHLPQNAPGCLTSHAPWLPYPKTWRPFAAFAAVFLPRLGNVAGLAQLRPELEILTAKIKKKTSQMLVSNFPSNHHNLDGLDFSRYKKNTWPFYGYLSHQSKSLSVVFFQKSGRQLKKNRNPPPPQKKTCFGYSSIHPWNLLVKVAGLHTLTFLAPRPGSSVCDGLFFWNWILSRASSSGLSRSWNHNRANRICTRWNHNRAEKVTPGAPVPRCHGAKQWEDTQLTTPKKAGTEEQSFSSWDKTSENSHQNMIPEKLVQGDP